MNQDTTIKYLKLVDSLRRAQRAELLDETNETIIEQLYTDPLENQFVLNTMLFDHTTLLIGRKGTGKSTIINRFQHEIRKTKDKLSLYLDVRTIYDQAYNSLPNVDEKQNILSEQEIRKYELYKHFFSKIISEIQIEINKNVFTNRFFKIFGASGLTESNFKIELEKIYEDINKPKYHDITALQEIKSSDKFKKAKNVENKITGEAKLSPSIEITKDGIKPEIGSISAKASHTVSNDNEELTTKDYSTVLIRYFNLIEFTNRLRDLLIKVGINHVFICLDDASELEYEALDLFIRSLVAPLHNSADGYFKFKISFYPGRDPLPEIDRTKVELINLDYYELYQSHGVDRMEELAISYTKRLIEGRFKYFFGDQVNLENYFETKKMTMDDYFRLIFQMTSNVARNIGKLLWYVGKKSITLGQKINKNLLQDAAKEHYSSEIELILYKNEYFQYINYNEQFEREHLKRFLQLIITRAKDVKKAIGESNAEIFKEYNIYNAPSNYLYFPPNLENLIATLELNFFISKYTQQKDRGQGSGKNYVAPKEVSVYTINYGLCQKENIIVDEKSDRKFRIERVFDYYDLIINWAKSAQIIRCSSCGSTYSFDKLEAIKTYGMLCEKCHNNTCEVLPVSIELPTIDIPKLREKQFFIINSLKNEDGLTSKQIAAELDCSTYTIGAITRVDRTLRVSEYINKDDEEKFHITPKALEIFYKDGTK